MPRPVQKCHGQSPRRFITRGQDDLEEDDVYLLDTFTTIFAWVGSQSNEVAPTHSVVPRHSCARFLLVLHA